MKAIPQYNFFRTKYGDELLIDVVELGYIKKYLADNPLHKLSYYDITVITGGSGTFTINGCDYVAKEQDTIFSRPGELRSWDTANINSGYALIFEEEFLLFFFNDQNFLQNLYYYSPANSSSLLQLEKSIYNRIIDLFHKIKAEINENPEKDRHILRALLYETLMLLNREYGKVYPHAEISNLTPGLHFSKFVELVKEYIYTESSTQFYAGKLCITPNYLNEIVKKQTGKSTKEYISEKRMIVAKRMILHTGKSIAEISEILNFSSPSHFNRFFMKQTNYKYTPLELRKKG